MAGIQYSILYFVLTKSRLTSPSAFGDDDSAVVFTGDRARLYLRAIADCSCLASGKILLPMPTRAPTTPAGVDCMRRMIAATDECDSSLIGENDRIHSASFGGIL